MDQKIKNILDFWFVETPSEKRFKKDSKFDNLIKEKFLKEIEKNKEDYEKIIDDAADQIENFVQKINSENSIQ